MTNYGSRHYWDERYTADDTPFDWMCDYSQLKPTLTPLLLCKDMNEEGQTKKEKPFGLVVGCGNAAFSPDFVNDGYTNVIHIDYCHVVVEQQKKKYPELDFQCMDGA